MIRFYELTIDLNKVRLGDVDDVVELARQQGNPVVDWAAKTCTVRYMVGDDEGIPDLWDLRGVVNELEIELDDYSTGIRFDKPRLVEG